MFASFYRMQQNKVEETSLNCASEISEIDRIDFNFMLHDVRSNFMRIFRTLLQTLKKQLLITT